MSTAPLLQAHAVTIQTPAGRTLVQELNLQVGRERVAIVGRNGVGKTTLLDVLAGQLAPSQGRVVCRGRRLLVPQQLAHDAQGDTEHAASPGELRRKRLEWARDARPDIMLLDEPTLDMDADNIAWLLGWLRQWREGLLVVSHDRRVLRAFNHFFVLAESGCRHVQGSFDDLLAELLREREDSERRYLGHLNRLVAQEEHNAAVGRRRQRKKNIGRIHELKRCPSRIKLNDKRSYKQESQGKRAVLQKDRIEAARAWTQAARCALTVQLPLQLALPRLPAASHAPVIRCERLTAFAGERVLFDDLSLEVGRDRLSVRGPNASGKSTLLEMALGLRRPAKGQARCDTLRVGYIAQNASNWCVEESVVELLAMTLDAASPDAVAQVLRAHRFPFALADRSLVTLSPGERVRAALICLTRRRPPPELLVLDEPTQHLDFVGLASIEAILAAWTGGLLVVSHDPEFLEALSITRTIDLSDGVHRERSE